VYIIACAYRLARFNVGALLPNKNKKRDPPVALGSPKFSAGELPPAATAPRSRHSRARLTVLRALPGRKSPSGAGL
jgi:hypothetical protein